MKKFLRLLFAGALLCTGLNGCTIVKTQVAYTVYPVGYLLNRIGGDTITAQSIQDDSIVQRAQLKENYEEILTDSAAFFHIGQLEPYLSVSGSSINKACSSQIDLSTLNAVYDFKRYTQVITDGEATYIESAYYKGDAFNLVDTDVQDLYLWTDPIAMLSMAKDVRDWLVKTFPEDKSVYEENFTKLQTDLINLDAQYQALATSNINQGKQIRFVSMTASFGNWQKTYGFQVYPVILSKYGALPNDEQLEIIKKRIKNDNVKYIVYEANMSEDMIELFNTLESELGLTRVELSNLSSLTQTQTDDGKDYISIMYENLSVLETMVEASSAAAEGDDTNGEVADPTATANPQQ